MKAPTPEEVTLVPELVQWNGGRGISLDEWAFTTVSANCLIAASRVFWPEFTEHDGCVFVRRLFSPARYADWLQETGGNRKAVERVVNHLHLEDLQDDGAWSEVQVGYIVAILVSMLRAKLTHEFPSRNFEVELIDTGEPPPRRFEITFAQRWSDD